MVVGPAISGRDTGGHLDSIGGDLDGPVTRSRIIDQGPPSGGPICQHRWSYVGRAPVTHPRCEDPIRIVCVECSHELIKRCGATRSTRCAPCADTHRRRLEQVIRSGVVADGISTAFFCTLTAPGAESLPWDPSKCSHRRDVACSGALGCQVATVPAADWNGTAARRWSWFITYLRRLLPGVRVEYCGTWEDQRRGVLHRHFCVRTDRPVSVKRMRVAVRSAAASWDFGRQIDVKGIDAASAAAAARYIAKYAAKTSDTSSSRVVLDRSTGELVSGRCVRPWSASWGWGDSMRRVRERQRAFIVANPAWVPGRRSGPGAPGAGAAGDGLDPNQEISTDPPPSGANACGSDLDHVGM